MLTLLLRAKVPNDRYNRLMLAPLPLDGIRILDLTWIIAGPVCTRILGDFGADVIKIEHEQAVDPIRMGRPIIGDGPTLNNSGFFNYINRNKRSILLNIRHPEGSEVFSQLVTESDVIIENFSSGVLESWGFGYDHLKELRKDIIYCSVSGFGHSGPDNHYTTWGPTAQALSGQTIMSGLPDAPPAGWGFSFMDHTAGYSAAIAILMALYHRDIAGDGQYIDLSQVEAGSVLTGSAVLDYTVNNRAWKRVGFPPGNHAWEPQVAPHNTYRTLERNGDDDQWIAIACLSDAEWESFVRVLKLSDDLSNEWVNDSAFSTNESRLRHQESLDRNIEKWTRARDGYELMALLQSAGIKAAVCQKPGDRVETDPQLDFREWWQTVYHPELGQSTYDGVAPLLQLTPGSVRKASPMFGEHTDEVMQEVLGLSSHQIADLRAKGVFM